jgi:hypothetical protein
MQKPRPIDVKGVPVSISIIEANGNYREIGNITSDLDDFFSFTWNPDIEGKFTVYASFGGSELYWPSHFVTAFNVGPETPTQAPTATVAPSVSEQYFLLAVAGNAILIAVGFAITMLGLRKRP